LFVAWFLFSSLLAANSTLHEIVHHDAAQSSHQCAITVFQQQQILAAEPHTFFLAFDFSLIGLVPPSHTPFIFSVDYTSPPGRGPPFSLPFVA
jgi:hypothetical protein